MKNTEKKPQSALELLVEAMAKRRERPSEHEKAWALAHGLKLRGRGRPRKSAKP